MAEDKNKASQYQENVFKLGDTLLTYCEKNSENKGQGILVILYGLMTHLSDEGDPLIDDIIKKIRELPIAYHPQALRILNDKYAVTVLQIGGGKMNKGVVKAKDMLMGESRNFNETTNRIPSPLEVIYLTINHFLAHPGDSKDEKTLFIAMMRDTKMQRLVLDQYLNAFEAKYREDLMKGVF